MEKARKAELQAIGALFREERRNNGKSTPRSEQSSKQLAATWKNSNGPKLATRVEAYQLWHAKENEGELLDPSEVMVVLEEYDLDPANV